VAQTASALRGSDAIRSLVKCQVRGAMCGVRRRTHRHRGNGLDGVFDVFTGINSFEESHIGTLVSGRDELETAFQQWPNPN
jgi:hypothetical protein